MYLIKHLFQIFSNKCFKALPLSLSLSLSLCLINMNAKCEEKCISGDNNADFTAEYS